MFGCLLPKEKEKQKDHDEQQGKYQHIQDRVLPKEEQTANRTEDKDGDVVDGVKGNKVAEAFWQGCFAFVFEVQRAKEGS